MTVMSTATGLPYGRPLTADDLDAIPDDGHRYELLDGTLLVSPAPAWEHQEVAGAVYRWLHAQCPPGLRVLIAPFAVRLAVDTELQPDVLVARYGELTHKNLPKPPLLAVEVRSPSTALIDRNLKRAAYERFGIPSYWLVDPRPDRPAVEVFELRGDRYEQVADVHGDETFSVQTPFPIALTPTALGAGLRPD